MERPTASGTTNLIDILDRVLDKGLVIAGDIRVSLANVELLTVRIRLLICSVDKAEQIGMNWWKHDPNLTTPIQAASPIAQFGQVPGARRAALAAPRQINRVARASAPRTKKKSSGKKRSDRRR
jgi:hypothetical protein